MKSSQGLTLQFIDIFFYLSDNSYSCFVLSCLFIHNWILVATCPYSFI